MANVKEVVILLCTLIDEIGCSPVLPETFRRAKFDDASVVDELWTLLYEMLCYKRTGLAKMLYAMESKDEMVAFVKREMYIEGYKLDSFIALPLPSQLSENSSSREILLAFGWLFATSDILQQFSNSCANMDTLYTSEIKNQMRLEETKPRSARNNNDMEMEIKVFNALALNNKVMSNLNSIAQSEREYAKMLHRHANSSSPDVMNNPSTVHLIINSTPEMIEKANSLLENDKRRLTILIHWRQQEHIFWQWLDSVLAEKNKARAEICEGALRSGFMQIIGDSYVDTADFLLQLSQIEKQVRKRLMNVPENNIDSLVDMMTADLEEFLTHSCTPEEPIPTSDAKLPTSRIGKDHSLQLLSDRSKAENRIRKLCDRLALELSVDQMDFSKLLKRMADINLS